MNTYRFEGETGFLEIESKHGAFSIVFDKEDFTRVKNINWFIRKTGEAFYCAGHIGFGAKNRYFVYFHRLIMSFPELLVIDHANHNGLDNRKSNLRVTSNSGNQSNSRRIRRKSMTGFRGVSFTPNGKPFRAMVVKNKKSQYLGRFETAEEAAAAYNEAVKEIHHGLSIVNDLTA